jgi:small-conductance mechanosensitive channel
MHSTPLIAFQVVPDQDLEVLRFFTPGRMISLGLILLSVWILIRFVTKLLNTIAARGLRVRFVVKWIEPVVRITLWFAAIFVSFNMLAPSRETFLAAVGSVAIAVALGAQDLVKNLVGGLVILADRPYQPGDRVRIGDAYGEIDQIGLQSTKLITPEDTRVTIPNANLLSSMAFNANSGVPDCQVVTDLFLPISTDPEEALKIGYEAAYTSPYVYLAKPVVVLVSDEFRQLPYLKLRVKAYVYDHRFEPQMQSDITARAKAEFLRRGLLADWQRGYDSADWRSPFPALTRS